MNIIKSKLFRRYLSLGVIICSTGFILSFYLTHLVLDSERNRHERYYQTQDIIDIINSIRPATRIKALEMMSKNRILKRKTRNMILLNSKGEVTYSTSPLKGEYKINRPPPPHFEDHPHRKGPKGDRRGAPRDGHRPPPPRRSVSLEKVDANDNIFDIHEIDLRGKPAQKLIMEVWKTEPANPERQWMFTRIIFFQIVGICLGVGLTFLIIYNHFKKRTKEIEVVLNNIRHGDLQSRMPVETTDEFGLAMKNFNVMADEIEQLVGKLRGAESTRRVLLGELAHDIRTPLASVKNFIEIIQTKEDKLSVEKKAEILATCQVEIEYMSRLVDDLLFLGKIEEPSYRQNDVEIDLEDIIATTAHNLKRIYPQIQFKYNAPSDQYLKVQMDEILTSRLFRNVLDNAFSFAKKEVSVNVVKELDGKIHISIVDDGNGFHPASLESFGEKKFSRQDRSRQDMKRISIGLGSVIMKRIVELYDGKFSAQNIESTDHKILGGQVNMILPS